MRSGPVGEMSLRDEDGFDPDELAPWEQADGRGTVAVSRWEPIPLDRVLNGEAVTPTPAVFERADGIRLLYPGASMR